MAAIDRFVEEWNRRHPELPTKIRGEEQSGVMRTDRKRYAHIKLSSDIKRNNLMSCYAFNQYANDGKIQLNFQAKDYDCSPEEFYVLLNNLKENITYIPLIIRKGSVNKEYFYLELTNPINRDASYLCSCMEKLIKATYKEICNKLDVMPMPAFEKL